MNESPANSFMRFFVGFTLFISVSFGVTFAAQDIARSQEAAHQQAAAIQAMLEYKK